MSEITENRTWADVVRDVAAEFGRFDVTDDEVDWILWERTPWPMAPLPMVEDALRLHFGSPS